MPRRIGILIDYSLDEIANSLQGNNRAEGGFTQVVNGSRSHDDEPRDGTAASVICWSHTENSRADETDSARRTTFGPRTATGVTADMRQPTCSAAYPSLPRSRL